MGKSVMPLVRIGEPDRVKSVTHERLEALRGEVYPDGGAATFTVQFTNQRPFKVLVPFDQMPALYFEVRAAAGNLVDRQALSMDAGASAILELCRNPMRPTHIGGMLHRRTWDRIYYLEFEDHAPLAISISPAQAMNLRARMDKLARDLAD